ncbi:hypothetical protein FQA39_LY11738 [Lamprigera yunnana]|nr:hypothetical protein FQA39_LY11738 [Lamprigera yunnana]
MESIQGNRKYGPEEICTMELKLSRKRMKMATNDNNTSDDEKKLSAFLICVFKKRSILHENGNVNPDGLKAFLKEIAVDHSKNGKTQNAFVNYTFNKCNQVQAENVQLMSIHLKNCITNSIQGFDAYE